METHIYTACLALAAGLIGWIWRNSTFKGPREVHGEHERRISTLETGFTQLTVQAAGTNARHDEALENLTTAVDRLTDRFERFMERFNHAATRGS